MQSNLGKIRYNGILVLTELPLLRMFLILEKLKRDSQKQNPKIRFSDIIPQSQLFII